MKRKATVSILAGSLLGATLCIVGCSERKTVEKQEHTQEKEHGHKHDHGEGHDHHHGHDFGNAHDHDHTPHHGIIVPFQSGNTPTGFAELKLHDDKGDLELWLTKDQAGKQPYDLPLDSVITVTFPKLDNKTVTLRIRNKDKNEDEDGKGNIRNNATNYFIFPGDTGVDATFLIGKDFATDAVISFSAANAQCATESFELRPHTH